MRGQAARLDQLLDVRHFHEGNFQFFLCEVSKILNYVVTGSSRYERGVSLEVILLLLDEEEEFGVDA